MASEETIGQATRQTHRLDAEALQQAQAKQAGPHFEWHYGRVTRVGHFGDSVGREVTVIWEEGGVTSQQGNISDEQWEIFKLAFLSTRRIAILSDTEDDRWMYDYRYLEAVGQSDHGPARLYLALDFGGAACLCEILLDLYGLTVEQIVVGKENQSSFPTIVRKHILKASPNARLPNQNQRVHLNKNYGFGVRNYSCGYSVMRLRCYLQRQQPLERQLMMAALLYTFLGVISLGLLIICVYFLLRKGRKADSAVAPVNQMQLLENIGVHT